MSKAPKPKTDWVSRTGFACWILAFAVVVLKSC